MFLRKREQVYKNNTVNADTFDKRRFNELLKMSKGLKDTKKLGDKEFPLFSQLMGDIWSSLYKSKPHLLFVDEISRELQTNHSYMEQIMEDDSFNTNREITRLDDLSSALSTISFSNKVMDWISERKKKNEGLEKAIKEAMNALNEKQQSEQDKESDQEHKKYEEKMKQLAEQLQNELSGSGNQLANMMKESVNEANKSKNDMGKLLGGLTAGDGEAEMEKVPLRDKFTLADTLRNNPKMKVISEWAGRFKKIARSKQKNLHDDSIERSGVSLGNNVDRLLPSELVNMAMPQTKTDFMRRFVEGETMQYDKKGKDTLGKGPIILCLDESGSMRKLEIQSKGFVLALMSIAKKQNRDFALISFSNKATVKVFPKGKSSTNDLISLAKRFMNGGTNFYDPLRKSLELVNESRFEKADIVFVTDGEANLPNEFVKKFNDTKAKKKFECLSILIGNQARRYTVEKFSDKVIHANDFTEAGEAFEV